MRVIGHAVPRLEDESLLRGKGRFVDDLHLPGMLEAAFVRSPHAHALVRSIRKDAALAVKGVHAVLVRADVLPYLRNEYMIAGLPSADYKQDLNRPALIADEAVHVGQPVAMVVADNRPQPVPQPRIVELRYPLARPRFTGDRLTMWSANSRWLTATSTKPSLRQNTYSGSRSGSIEEEATPSSAGEPSLRVIPMTGGSRSGARPRRLTRP